MSAIVSIGHLLAQHSIESTMLEYLLKCFILIFNLLASHTKSRDDAGYDMTPLPSAQVNPDPGRM